MKKFTLLLLGCIVTSLLFAQVPVIKNSSFENWTNIGGNLYPDDFTVSHPDAVATGAIARKTGGTDGSYCLHSGSLTDNGVVIGSGVTIIDTLTSHVGGISFDCRVQNNIYEYANGLDMVIYFYDNNGNYLDHFSWFSPPGTNYNSFVHITWEFNSPYGAFKYNLEMGYLNLGTHLNEYGEIDNVKFLPSTNSISKKDSNSTPIVYPNPASSTISIDNSKMKADDFSLFDLCGNCIMKKELQIDINWVDINHLPAGIYVVRITDKTGSIAQKLIKQ